MTNEKQKPQKPCDKCWLKYSSYCVDCACKAIGLGLVKEKKND